MCTMLHLHCRNVQKSASSMACQSHMLYGNSRLYRLHNSRFPDFTLFLVGPDKKYKLGVYCTFTVKLPTVESRQQIHFCLHRDKLLVWKYLLSGNDLFLPSSLHLLCSVCFDQSYLSDCGSMECRMFVMMVQLVFIMQRPGQFVLAWYC
jgi:hypothetical protein